MPFYEYTALDDIGRTLRGKKEASSQPALQTMLRREGLWLTTSRERREAAASSAESRPRGNYRVPRRVLIEFFLQASLQLRSGIALVDALSFGLADCMHPGFRMVQVDIIERLKSGATFSEAAAAHPRTFAPLVLNLVRAGESSGRLAEACTDIRVYYEWVDRLVSDVRQATLYPAFVLVATIAFFFLVFTFLIPRFAEVLAQLKVDLPLLTQVFLAISKFMVAHAWAVVAVLVLGIVGLKMGPRYSPAFAQLMDRFKLWMPVLGPLHHLICLARVTQNLATLYRAGIPVISALQLCRPLAGNRVLEDALVRVEADVNSGSTMQAAMKDQPVFSRLLVQMVGVGETTGSLGDSLQHVADYYNEVVPRQLKKLLSIMEPVMIIGLIVMVGAAALAVFLPLASAMDAG